MLKKKLFWGLLMFLLLALAVWLLSHNQGYVLIVRAPYRVQFSFNFLLFLMVVAFLTLHYLLRFIRYLRFFPAHWRVKKAHKHLKESHDALIETVNALLKEDFSAATQTAKRAHDLHEESALLSTVQALQDKTKSP